MDRTDLKTRMNELAERAKKRCIDHASIKTSDDTMFENCIFKDLELHVYKNIDLCESVVY